MSAATKKTTKKTTGGGGAKGKSAAKTKTVQNNRKEAAKKDPLRVELFAIGYIAVAVVLFLVFLFFRPADAMNGAGVVGVALAKFFAALLGKARFCLPLWLLLLGWFYWRRRVESFPFGRSVAFSIVLFLTLISLFGVLKPLTDYTAFVETAADYGGYIGDTLSWLLLKAFGRAIALVILIVLLLISLVAITGISFFGFMQKAGNNLGEAGKAFSSKRQERKEQKAAQAPPAAPLTLAEPVSPIEPETVIVTLPDEEEVHFDPLTGEIVAAAEPAPDGVEVNDEYDVDFPSLSQHIAAQTVAPLIEGEDPEMDLRTGAAWDELPSYKDKPIKKDKKPPVQMEEITVEPFRLTEQDSDGDLTVHEGIEAKIEEPPRPYQLPKTTLLRKNTKMNQKEVKKSINESVAILEKTLASFGVSAKVTEVSYGPAITRFEVQPGAGVKVSKIVGLADDIALQLKSAGIRMEAPVPGKSVIGIEVPRQETITVSFRDILENSNFFKLNSKLICAFGKDIAGQPVLGDLATMPHLLIAGATGSGKSVCMNTIICSLLFKAKPAEVKFIMIDPKRVEFAAYEDLPHLITPVVTDPKKAAGSLKWALREMENRYALFNTNRVKNLESYNQLVTQEEDRLPQIVVFIDELADLMMVAAKDVEESICRLAQMARAAGIHLVIATQRPSVDVITGLIKANIPSRIAFAVSSQTDSRTILDMGGAEKLLGRGDMLYHPVGMAKPLRVQGAFVGEEEAQALLEYVKSQGRPTYDDNVAQPIATEQKRVDMEDELFHEAAKAVITAGQASASMLQRRFRIGYNRAARLMEVLQEKGIVGPVDGAKPRQVLMTLDNFLLTFPLPERDDVLFKDE